MIFVTGGTGLLGTHLLMELAKGDEPVRALIRKNSSTEYVQLVFRFYKTEQTFGNIQWVEGDVLDTVSLEEGMKDCTKVYHSAAIVSYHRKDRKAMYQINVEGTANVLNCALAAGVEKFCHVSSIAALGRKHDKQTLDETAEWGSDKLHTHYGITKHLSELEVWRAMQEGLKAVIINPGFIIGAGDASRSSTSVLRKMEGWIPYYPPGGTGMVGAKDVASCAVKLMNSEISGERFVITSENISFRDYFKLVREALGKKPPSKVSQQWILDAAAFAEWFREVFTGRKALVTKESILNSSLEFFYDNSKAKKELVFEFESVKDAVQEALMFYKENK